MPSTKVRLNLKIGTVAVRKGQPCILVQSPTGKAYWFPAREGDQTGDVRPFLFDNKSHELTIAD